MYLEKVASFVFMFMYIRLTVRETYRISEHGAQMRGKCQECEQLKYDQVDGRVDGVGTGQQHHVHHHEFGVENQHPSHDGANYAANVLQKKNK